MIETEKEKNEEGEELLEEETILDDSQNQDLDDTNQNESFDDSFINNSQLTLYCLDCNLEGLDPFCGNCGSIHSYKKNILKKIKKIKK